MLLTFYARCTLSDELHPFSALYPGHDACAWSFLALAASHVAYVASPSTFVLMFPLFGLQHVIALLHDALFISSIWGVPPPFFERVTVSLHL